MAQKWPKVWSPSSTPKMPPRQTGKPMCSASARKAMRNMWPHWPLWLPWCIHQQPTNQMPVYQYINDIGRVVEDYRPIHLRDTPPVGFRRITVPVHIGWVGCRENPHTVDFKSKGALR